MLTGFGVKVFFINQDSCLPSKLQASFLRSLTMVYSFANILDSQLALPVSNPSLSIIRHIRSLHPQDQFIPTIVSDSDEFPLAEYLSTVLQTSPKVAAEDSHLTYYYDSSQTNQKTYPEALAGIVTFPYKDIEFRAYKVTWTQGWETYCLYGLIYDGPDDALGQELATAVYRYANCLKKEVWIYEAGRWSKSKQLYKSIRSASWDDVVLKEEFKEGLRRDTETFFHSKDVYDSLGITWKRGILLLGPPGNGKTESIKALLNEFDQSTLYVKSFTTKIVRTTAPLFRS